jgi:S-adenosylmethionine decarboxylase proenzyme
MDIGTHLIVDIFEIKPIIFNTVLAEKTFNDFDKVVEDSIKRNNMTLLNKTIHFFPSEYEGAFTSLYLLSESHLSMHSWPEKGYLALDIFTCGNCNTNNILNDILSVLQTNVKNVRLIRRGIYNNPL